MGEEYLVNNHYNSLNPESVANVSPKMMKHADKVMDFLELHPLTTLMIACKAVSKAGHRISVQTFQSARRQSPCLCDRYAAFKVDKVENNVSVAEKAMFKRINGFTKICVERTMERQIVTDEITGEDSYKWVITKEKKVEKYFPPSEKLIEFYLETKGNYIKVLHIAPEGGNVAKPSLSPEAFYEFLKEQGIKDVSPINEIAK